MPTNHDRYEQWLEARAEMERAQVQGVSPDSPEGLALQQAEADAAHHVPVWRRVLGPQAVTTWEVHGHSADGRVEVRKHLSPVDVLEWQARADRTRRYERIEVYEMDGLDPTS